MTTPVLMVADAVAILILTFAVYLPRHRRRDLVVAFLGVNIGVLAVSTVLASAMTDAAASVGLGMGLFGVLSIIRLRSDELAQHEIAYYFSALALGLIGGIGTGDVGLSLALMGLVLGTMVIGDHPRLLPAHRRQVVHLDRAVPDQADLVARLEQLLGARVLGTNVLRLDLVDDTTLVDVRFAVRAGAGATTAAGDMVATGPATAAAAPAREGSAGPVRAVPSGSALR